MRGRKVPLVRADDRRTRVRLLCLPMFILLDGIIQRQAEPFV
jgi:hypothetical protein